MTLNNGLLFTRLYYFFFKRAGKVLTIWEVNQESYVC